MNHLPNQFAGLPLGQELPNDRTVTLIFSHFGKQITEVKDEAEAVNDIHMGQVERADTVIQYNIAEGWSRDISEDVARELIKIAKPENEDEGYGGITDYLEQHLGCSLVERALSETLYG